MNDSAKNLLRACAENLLDAVNRLENSQTPSESQTSTQNQTFSHGQLSSQTSSQGQTLSSCHIPTPRRTAAEEHRSLFGYRPPSARAGKIKPPPKRRMVTTSTGEQISVPIRNTWSRTFMCLTKGNAVTPPSTMDKMNMALAGLEEQTITFTKSGNSDHVHQKILEAFPMLAEVGGYEILSTG